MSNLKTPCPYQGAGKENPVWIGGYDSIRPTDEIDNPDYWISSGETAVYDAAYNNGAGGILNFYDRLRISKGASGGCTSTVSLDIEANPLIFSYYPPHSLDVVFVLDVTSSMMTNGSRKMALAKRALIQTIHLLWEQNRQTRVTIVPYARDAYVPLATAGFSYDYLGTLFTWRRSTASGYRIGQILGYRNGSFVSSSDLPTYMDRSAPIAASAELSLYNYYRYYRIQYSDIYNDDGSAKTDSILKSYLETIYAQDPGAYNGNFIQNIASGIPLDDSQLPYSMNDTGYENNTILDNMIWAIPYGEDTNTEAGLKEAYTLFTTPGFAQSDDILRRAVILLTDGQANRSDNPEYAGVYAQPSSTDGDFFPEIPGDPWRYYLYLQQTLPSLIAEISNRSATTEELILAMARAWEAARKLKDPFDGNTSVFVLGIEINAQTPGPYTREDVLNIMRTIASTGAYLREATESGSDNPIIEELKRLVRDLFVRTGGLRVTITDTINTSLFEYVPGSLRITGEQDQILLKSKYEPDITDPGDPAYTVYVKPNLLPYVGDANVLNGVITIDLGTLPFPVSSPDSRTRIRITYNITNKGAAHGSHLHTDNDEETFTTFLEPNHLTADSSVLDYGNAPRHLHFQTPVVSCQSGYTIEKLVGVKKDDISYKSITVQACQTVYYRIIIQNYTDTALTFPLLYDVPGVQTIEEARLSEKRQLLDENLIVPAQDYVEYIFQYTTRCGDGVLHDVAVLETGTDYLYDSAAIQVCDGSVRYTVQYLNRCTGKRICPDQQVSCSRSCTKIPASRHITCIPHWKFVCAEPYFLNPCEGETVLKLYYIPD